MPTGMRALNSGGWRSAREAPAFVPRPLSPPGSDRGPVLCPSASARTVPRESGNAGCPTTSSRGSSQANRRWDASAHVNFADLCVRKLVSALACWAYASIADFAPDAGRQKGHLHPPRSRRIVSGRLARRLTTMLPAMRLADARETTRMHRVAGLTGARTTVVTTRPCRAPITPSRMRG
jgi:hypothetical protein